MTGVHVRVAGLEDLDGIAAVDESFRREGTPEWSLMSRTTFETSIAVQMVLVASVEAETIGYLAWSLLWGFPFIDYIRVVAERRGGGIGTSLLDAMKTEVVARGYRMIWSSTQDARALRWHERNGFTRVGKAEWIWGGAPEAFLMKEL